MTSADGSDNVELAKSTMKRNARASCGKFDTPET